MALTRCRSLTSNLGSRRTRTVRPAVELDCAQLQRALTGDADRLASQQRASQICIAAVLPDFFTVGFIGRLPDRGVDHHGLYALALLIGAYISSNEPLGTIHYRLSSMISCTLFFCGSTIAIRFSTVKYLKSPSLGT